MPEAVELHLFAAGSCRHSAWFVEGGPVWRGLNLPAMIAVIRHPRLGAILFDAGYGQPLLDSRTLPARIYRRLLPFRYGPSDSIGTHLQTLGLGVQDLAMVILSHFHPDHIGGLRDVPATPILHSREGLAALRGLTGRARAEAAFFPELLPEDFASRGTALEDRARIVLGEEWRPFGEAFDIAGDGTLLAVALPGHALGQYGLLCHTRGGWVFLVADAAWTRRNIEDAAMPGWPVRHLMPDAQAFGESLGKLAELRRRRPEVRVIPSHCAASIEAYRNAQ
jgi:glyoxylase-like metal-dependent hydrolase (beta-lactamase superfamily II)